MNLRIFFDTVKTNVAEHVKVDPASLYNHIIRYENDFPSFDYADMAIIGLTEDRGALNASGTVGAADAVREKLYALKKGNGACRIIDLGNLRYSTGLGISWFSPFGPLKLVFAKPLNKQLKYDYMEE